MPTRVPFPPALMLLPLLLVAAAASLLASDTRDSLPETARRVRPRGGGEPPSPAKARPNDSAGRRAALASTKDALASSQEALIVTEKKYLKRDWCKTHPLKQTIGEEGCLGRTIINRFCYGQCNSFYIPRHARRDPSAAAAAAASSSSSSSSSSSLSFKSCSFCKPHRYTTLTVTLTCPEQQPPVRRKRVQRVKQCRCISVQVND
ncbi:gremlin-2-like [Lethenteron reissneri]|uniref:gremlin-2-like n=1 Tax=Lethenteron reissneri TaxID=7753 RepID=UPI002AB74F73|nr:gremlin-2-like [Lethenteron reissneri]